MGCEHSWFSPSAAKRILLCPASVKELAKLPKNEQETSSSYADRGTECHKAMEDLDTIGVIMQEFKEEWQETAVNEVRRQRDKLLPENAKILTEVKVNLGAFGHKDIFGTVDVLAMEPGSRVLYVVDYKFGQGVDVKAVNNPQLMIYALGAFALFPETERLKLCIIQPRTKEEPDVWETKREWLEDWLTTTLLPAIRKAKEGKEYGPSEEACRWCPASKAATCKAVVDELLDMLPELEEMAEAEDLDPKLVKKILDKQKFVVQILKKIEARATHLAESGLIKIPGYKLVKTYGNTRWKDEDKVDKWLQRKKYKWRERYNVKVLSPAQTRKLLGRDGKLSTRVINWIEKQSFRPEKGYKLVPESDKRPEAVTAVEQLPDLEGIDEIL